MAVKVSSLKWSGGALCACAWVLKLRMRMKFECLAILQLVSMINLFFFFKWGWRRRWRYQVCSGVEWRGFVRIRMDVARESGGGR